MELYPFDYSNHSQKLEQNNVSLDRYLKSEEFLEIEDNSVLQLAAKAAPKDLKGEQLVRSIFNFTNDFLQSHSYVPYDRGVLGAIQHGGGDCSDFTDFFVALCRARNIPARHIHGVLAKRCFDTPKHQWAEVFLEQKGWIRVEPFWKAFDNLGNHYITLTYARNTCIYSGSGAPFGIYATTGDPVQAQSLIDSGYGTHQENF